MSFTLHKLAGSGERCSLDTILYSISRHFSPFAHDFQAFTLQFETLYLISPRIISATRVANKYRLKTLLEEKLHQINSSSILGKIGVTVGCGAMEG